MGFLTFEKVGHSWGEHEKNFFLTRRTAEQRKVEGPGYGLTGKSVALIFFLVAGAAAAILKHENDVHTAQRIVSERVAKRLGYPQDEEDVLERLKQVVESSLHSVSGDRPEKVIIELKGTDDGSIDGVTINDIPIQTK